MSDIVFVSYEPEDKPRADAIIAALRDAGVIVVGDQPIPSGSTRRETYATALEMAWVVLVLWSSASTQRGENRYVAAEAVPPRERGAYLGVLLDKVQPPFGFSGLQTVDMGSWAGGRDRKLDKLVETVKQRMTALPVGAAEEELPADNTGRNRLLVIGAIAAVLLVAVALWVTKPWQDDGAARERVLARMAAIPCTWLNVDAVDDGTKGKIVLTGVADQPERAGETIRSLYRTENQPMEVTVDRVARIGSEGCPAIEETRRLRRDDGGRVKVTSNDVGQIGGTGLAEQRVKLAFKGGDTAMTLFGIEPNGKVSLILPDFASLDALKDLDVGLVKTDDRNYEFSVRSDHTGWTGLILVVGSQPLPDLPAQGTVQDPKSFADWLARVTRGGDWQTDMVWYDIMGS